MGYRPKPALVSSDDTSPYLFDEELGWRNRPGRYTRTTKSNAEKVTTIWENSARATAPARNVKSEQIVILGCSFTNGGFMIDDSETYSWKLQERFPSLDVINFGTNGYGTFQSLLLLERVLPSLSNPQLVIYGFVDFHETRNVNSWAWAKGLASQNSDWLRIPFATQGSSGKLIRHPPEPYLRTALDVSSSFVGLLEDAYARLVRWNRESEAQEVTHLLVKEIRTKASEFGSDFAVVYLHDPSSSKSRYIRQWEKEGIQVVDCVHPNFDRSTMASPEDGHPNGVLHAYWAECIAQNISKKFNAQ